MFNTVVLRGKGMGVAIFFHGLLHQFPDAYWHEPKLRWWQSTTRYELRMQNLTPDEIRHLKIAVNVGRPLTSYIDVEVF